MKNAGIIDPEDPRWPEAERRDALLRRLLKASGWQLTREVVETAREELGIPRSTLFRLVARFRRTKRTTSLLPQATGTPSGAKRIDPKVEVFDHRANRPLLAQEGTAFHQFLDATRA